MRVYEAIAEEIQAQGVRACFPLMSEDTMKLIVAVERSGVAIYNARHEHVAVGMADGFARASGEIGLAVLGRGPGLTQGLNALITASRGSAPVVVITGDSKRALADNPDDAALERKFVRQADLMVALGVREITLRSAETARSDLSAAFALARTGRTVVVNVPVDVQDEEAGTADSLVELAAAHRPEPGAPDPEQISLIADLLAEPGVARKPLVLAGLGATSAGAQADLIRIADAIGALLGTSLLARSAFGGHEFDLGVIGTFSTPVASGLVAGSDLVLSFGASLNRYTTFRGELFGKARVIHVDADPDAFGRHQEVDMGVVGDAQLTAAMLADELEKRGHQRQGYRTDRVRSELASYDPRSSFRDIGAPGALDPRTVMVELDEMLPKKRVVVVDGGNHFATSTAYLSVPEPGAYLFPGEYAATGVGLGVALGAAVAGGDRVTVLSIGDGGIMMGLADLDTAVRYHLPLVTVIVNDSAFGAEMHLLRALGLPDDTAKFVNPSFAGVARELGARAVTVRTMADLHEVRKELDTLDGPLVIDCHVTQEVRGHNIDFHLGSVNQGMPV